VDVPFGVAVAIVSRPPRDMPMACPVDATPAAIPPTPALTPASPICAPASIAPVCGAHSDVPAFDTPVDANFNRRHIDSKSDADEDPQPDAELNVESEIASAIALYGPVTLALALYHDVQLPSEAGSEVPWVWHAEGHLKIFDTDFDDDAESPLLSNFRKFKLNGHNKAAGETKTERQAEKLSLSERLSQGPHTFYGNATPHFAGGAFFGTLGRSCRLAFFVLGHVGALPAPMGFAIWLVVPVERRVTEKTLGHPPCRCPRPWLHSHVEDHFGQIRIERLGQRCLEFWRRAREISHAVFARMDHRGHVLVLVLLHFESPRSGGGRRAVDVAGVSLHTHPWHFDAFFGRPTEAVDDGFMGSVFALVHILVLILRPRVDDCFARQVARV